MTPYDLPDGGRQDAGVEASAQAQAAGNVVGRTVRVELVQKPQPFLGEGERRRPVVVHPDQRRRLSATTPRLDARRQLGQRLRLERHRERQLDAEVLAQARDQAGRQQRVTAELEEVVVAADRANPEEL